MSGNVDYMTGFKKQKPLTKAEVLAIEPGSLIEVKWQDSPNTVGILLEKPKQGSGDVSLHVWYPENLATGCANSVNTYAVHSQVVALHGKLEFNPILCSLSAFPRQRYSWVR